MNAHEHLKELEGREIPTLTGRSNRILRIEGSKVIVATGKSPVGKPVPVEWVQQAMDMLERDGEVAIEVATVGYRSAFIGAVLLTLPGAEAVTGTRRIRLPHAQRPASETRS